VKRKPDYLQFKPYRAIVATPIKPQRKKLGGLFAASPSWGYGLLLLLGGTLAVVFWRTIRGWFH